MDTLADLDCPLQRYSQLKNSSQRKLLAFFGDSPPLDIPLSEIKKEGIKALLLSKLPLCYFLRQLLDDYAHENLFFWLEMQRFSAATFASNSAQVDAAISLYATYLAPHSPLEINIDDRIRRNITSRLESLTLFVRSSSNDSINNSTNVTSPQQHLQSIPQRRQSLTSSSPIGVAYRERTTIVPPQIANSHGDTSLPLTSENIPILLNTLFDTARDAVFILMDSVYTKFVRSQLFNRMSRDLHNLHVVTPRSRNAALLVLGAYLDQNDMINTNESNGSSTNNSPPGSPVTNNHRSSFYDEYDDVKSEKTGAPPRVSLAGSRDTWNLTTGYSPNIVAPSTSNILNSSNDSQSALITGHVTHHPNISTLSVSSILTSSHIKSSDPQKTLLRRMIRGFTITLLGIDVIEFARSKLDAAAFDPDSINSHPNGLAFAYDDQSPNTTGQLNSRERNNSFSSNNATLSTATKQTKRRK